MNRKSSQGAADALRMESAQHAQAVRTGSIATAQVIDGSTVRTSKATADDRVDVEPRALQRISAAMRDAARRLRMVR